MRQEEEQKVVFYRLVHLLLTDLVDLHLILLLLTSKGILVEVIAALSERPRFTKVLRNKTPL